MMASPSGLYRVSSRASFLPEKPYTYDASATSRPDGEMDAEPTRPGTWIVMSRSNVSLSDALLMVFRLGESRSSESCTGIMKCAGFTRHKIHFG